MIKRHLYRCPVCGHSKEITGPAPVKATPNGSFRNVKQCPRALCRQRGDGVMMERVRA